MTDQSVFTGETPPQKPTLEDLVGEGRKYATTEDALNSVPDKEFHIKNLETQNAEMLKTIEELQRRADEATTLDKVLERLQGKQEPTQVTPEESTSPDVSVFERKLQEFEQALPERFATLRAQEQAEANVMTVHNELTKQYGDAAASVLRQRAQELGVSVERLKDMAAESPRAVLELFPKKGANPGSPKGDLNTTTQDQGSAKNFAAWEKLRREDPKTYFTPAVQQRIMRDAKELGSAFYSR